MIPSTPAVVVVACSLDELRVLVREAIREELSAHNEPAHAALLTLDGLAHAEGCSVATIRRLKGEGGPCSYVGASPRFDLTAWRTWTADRGRKGTKQGGSKTRPALVAGVRLLSKAAR